MPNVLVELSEALAAAAERAGASTVRVDARRRMPASGIATGADLVLTADHVVEREEGIQVTLPDGTGLSATLAGRDPGSDLALLRLKRAAAAPARPAKPARVGQLVLALGRPTAEGLEASLGVVSAVGGPLRTRRGLIDSYIRTDTTPFPGFSGGPLVDAEGLVAGLNTSGFGHGAALTVPADLAWKIAAQLAKHGSVQRGYLGVRSQAVEVPAAAQQALKREQPGGLLVMNVERGSPAESAGLMVGDIIVALNERAVADHDELYAGLSGDLVGASVPLQVLRGGQPQNLQVRVGVRP